MIQVRYIALLLLVVLTIVFVNFFYFGITSKEPTSLDYNVPIAKRIISGEIFHTHSSDIYLYSPGSSHTFLAVFLLLGLPNLFGLLGFAFLFVVCKKLGDTCGLNRYMAFIFAASFCTTIAVIRTISDQSIDKWLCAWFVLSLIFLEKPSRSWKFALLLGLSLGMLVGTKYSGPLFLLALLPVYGKMLIRFLSPMRFLVASIVFTIVGLFWYIRNFILEGNPYYPANIPFFKGYHNFTQQDWMLWRIPIKYPEGLLPLANSFVSEYMIWSLSWLVILWFVIHTYRKKQKFDNRILRVIILAVTTGLVSLLLPITPPYKIELFHVISDMRYIYIFVLMLILATFLIANKYKKNELLATASLLNAIPLFSFIPYQPKIFVVCILLFLVIYSKKIEFLQRFFRF